MATKREILRALGLEGAHEEAEPWDRMIEDEQSKIVGYWGDAVYNLIIGAGRDLDLDQDIDVPEDWGGRRYYR